MKTAVIQMGSSDCKEENIKRAVHLVETAASKKAEFILLPEVFNYRGKALHGKGFQPIAETIPGKSTLPLVELAKKQKVFILAGSICEKIPSTSKVYNTSALISPLGKIIRYRKRHLFDADLKGVGIKESAFFKPGEKGVQQNVLGFNAGLSICFDLRFPKIFRDYFFKGADLFCLPSNFTRITGFAHWEVLLRARAIENLSYVLAPNQVGVGGGGIEAFGNSMIVDPWGKIIARASAEKEEIIYAVLSKKEIAARRKMLIVSLKE